jgi:hypothetical protein
VSESSTLKQHSHATETAPSPPLDVLDQLVRLETGGWSEEKARAEGYASLAALAAMEYGRAAGMPIAGHSRTPEKPRQRWREYLEGVSFALPLLLCGASILIWNVSLWGGDLAPEASVAVALATVLSFVATGGAVQAMARRMFFFLGVQQWSRAADAIRSYSWWAFLLLMGCGVSAGAVVLYYTWLPPRMLALAMVFYLMLGTLWILAGVLYTLHQSVAVSGVVALGITAVIALQWAGVELVPAQVAALLVALTAALVLVMVQRRQLARRSDTLIIGPLGRGLYSVWPYFLYGLFYYLLLFSDRLMAWTAGTSAAAFTVQFRADYETAHGIALMGFVFQVGWAPVVLGDIQAATAQLQRRFTIAETTLFNQAMLAEYGKGLLRLCGVCAVAIGLVLGAQRVLGAAVGSADPAVLACAALGYGCIVIALFHVNLMFVLGKSYPAVKAAAVACGLNLLVAYTASRLGTYSDAAWGLVVGALAFAVLTGVAVLRILRRFDHHHFAAGI